MRVRRRWVASLVAAAGTGALATGALLETSTSPTGPAAMPLPGLRIPAVGSWVRIHPARAPGFCLTEGRDRTGRCPTAVAAQRPCAEATLPRVYLEPAGEDAAQIQWHHPEFGIGCLTTLLDGPGRDLLEPRDDCVEGEATQRFRFESFGPPAAAHFRIRPVSTGQCLSLRDQDTEAGAEIVQGRCSTAADQEFLIEPIAPP
ncbi:RICIN domain-containing protein [Amycolatopsis sp.]|uniref:RICIN domain-containing protein n=1 Tax=Amycolatopsis sp. TaxID=37632 RepID=UPI002D7F29D8|nr:RICIN domain-containing protein [Amycolatopsis sp.]HET6707008.1 RICIN domain-containing protein [Amycolatopsis sp.]